ncbi:hypothetical protein K402DRAFT_461867 [Aulographum hederae CBS 113979]|uniref:Alpha/beta-hydrolase n=1 Tax=Aulographum hederae CBS 113979 TaxID=1176131 RepID=A0A6G1H5W7_9PEZI|nr:hypothetical protein K402DRAFT_461867 [Aulographum hederae CBS 113979]
MKFASLISIGAIAGTVYGQQPGGQINSPEALASPGTGPYAAHFFEDPSLPKYVIYQPKEIPAGFKAPLLVWGNGGCLNVGTIMAPFLLQLASQGVVVIATGPKEDPSKGGTYESFGSYGQAKPEALTAAIDWAEKSTRDPKWAHIDTSRGKRDYGILPQVPAFMSNWAATGHGGTYNEPTGGEYGIAASHWVNWILRGQTSSAAWFKDDGGATAAGWTEVGSKYFDRLEIPSPL